MKRIILFRYHHQFARNKELLRFMKYLNPGIEIYGMYGGPEELFENASVELYDVLAHNYLIKDKDKEWKWKNSDMAFRLWYNDFGHTISFDILHTLEWDLLYFSSLNELFKHVPENAAAFTGLIQLRKIEKKWYWTSNEQRRKEWFRLMGHLRECYYYNQDPYGMIGPGASFPRIFFEKMKDFEIPDILHDEIRLPVLAQLFGVDMRDTYFFRQWFSKNEFRFFNSNEFDVDIKDIEKELKKRCGRRAFHPYRGDLNYKNLVDLYNSKTDRKCWRNQPQTKVSGNFSKWLSG